MLAVALDTEWLTVALVGLGGRIIDRRDRRHERGGHAVEAVVESVALLCEELLAGAGVGRIGASGWGRPSRG